MRVRHFAGRYKQEKTEIDNSTREDMIIDVISDILAEDFDNDPDRICTKEEYLETRTNFKECLDIRADYYEQKRKKD